MAELYCKGHRHGGSPLCTECAALLEYATGGSSAACSRDAKPTCANCWVHCYTAEMREKVRVMMRWAGPPDDFPSTRCSPLRTSSTDDAPPPGCLRRACRHRPRSARTDTRAPASRRYRVPPRLPVPGCPPVPPMPRCCSRPSSSARLRNPSPFVSYRSNAAAPPCAPEQDGRFRAIEITVAVNVVRLQRYGGCTTTPRVTIVVVGVNQYGAFRATHEPVRDPRSRS